MSTSHPVLQALVPIAEGIAKTIGNNCEVAIHDLTHPRNSIFYIANGAVTGRSKGDSLGPVFKKLIELATMNEDSLINYYDFENGHSLKCSKVLIRDENQKIIGCFCINISIDEYLQSKRITDALCMTEPIDKFSTGEESNPESTDDIADLVRDMISNTYEDFRSSKGRMTKADKMEMVKFLDEKGIFRVKGTIEMVASILKVSKFTIYSYLDQIRSDS
ncbi:PAS domain-containing protein [Bacillota bacterium]